MALASDQIAYVQVEPAGSRPPPVLARGVVAWVRQNLVSSWANAILTIAVLYLLYLIVPPAVRFLITDAVWTGADRDACLPDKLGREVGACWPFVMARLGYFIYGQYPVDLRWRVNLVFLLEAIGIVWLLWPRAPRKALGALFFFVIFPAAAFVLLLGARPLGLEPVPTYLWGGILVTMVIATIGIVVSLPFGIVLALGRRSKLPIVRLVCIVFIEVVRGVPLITVLFMANRMLPLFLSQGMQPDALFRVIVGVALFASAYMAEVVRGGLQAISKGQYEGAMSLGLGYWKMMVFIILPQALTIVIPGIVNTFIGLFKDTTLVTVVGIFDFLTTVQASINVPEWSSPTTAYTGYAFAVLFYFLCCYGMSRYSLAMERRLATGHR